MGKPLACASCGEAVAGAVRLVDGHLIGACPTCGEAIDMSLAHRAAASASAEPDGDPCPKCGDPVTEVHAACPRCGLARERFESFDDNDIPDSPELAALWEAVEADWNDADAHETYIGRAVSEGTLARAARRYRAADAAGRDGAAERIARIRRMAEATLIATKPAGGKREPFRLTLWVLIALVFLAGIAAIATFLQLQGASSEAEAERPKGEVTSRPGFPGVEPAEDAP